MSKNEFKASVPATVLVVDDDPIIRMQAGGFLSQAGFLVTESADGDSALAALTENPSDLILLDVEMPALDGFEVCRRVRENHLLARIPIIMMTGLDDRESIDKAYDAGANDFATKPVSWSILAHRLRYMYRASKAAEQLSLEQSRLASAQRLAQMGSWELDCQSGAVVWSEQLYRMLGITPCLAKPGPNSLFGFVHDQDLRKVERWYRNALNMDTETSIEHRVVITNGSVRSVRHQIEPCFDAAGELVSLQAIVQDCTEQKKVESKIHKLAYFDTLTGLPNRVSFRDSLEIALQSALRNNSRLAVLYFDLDDFKRINDTFGHAVGDRLLQIIGERVSQCLRVPTFKGAASGEGNTLARMSGDEFTIIMSDVSEVRDAEMVARLIIDEVSKPLCIDGYEMYTSPSVGISLFPDDGDCADQLLKNADMAMYEAKRHGKKGFVIHDDTLDAGAQRRYQIDACLRTALELGEFELHYQPQVDINTWHIYGAEALLRWNNQVLGVVSPEEFVPVAEENGLIVSIGEWVLNTACEQAKIWNEQKFPITKVAVNVSAMQFMRVEFPDAVAAALLKSGLPADHLELEITESLLVSDVDHAVRTLQQLNFMGVELSIDDFGTGYSSLSQLKYFPIHRLKIDRSFIRSITEDNDNASITRAVIAMSRSMGIRVLAEGVESIEQLQFLKDNQCCEIQGFLISKPLTVAEFRKEMPALLKKVGLLLPSPTVVELRKAG